MTTEDALKELLKKIWEAWTIFEGLLKTLKLETGSYGTLCKAAKDTAQVAARIGMSSDVSVSCHITCQDMS